MNKMSNVYQFIKFFLCVGIFLTTLLLYSCESSVKHGSKNVIATGRVLSRLIDHFEIKNGFYPESLKIISEEYKDNISGGIDNELWHYIKDDSYYILIYGKTIDGQLYIFRHSSQMGRYKIE